MTLPVIRRKQARMCQRFGCLVASGYCRRCRCFCVRDDERLVIVHLAENNEYGMPRGAVSAVHFSDSLSYDPSPVLELESTVIDDDGDGPPCSWNGYLLRIGDQSYSAHGRRAHVGNICWNGYRVSLANARRLAADLVNAHGFTVDAWTEGQPFLAVPKRGATP